MTPTCDCGRPLLPAALRAGDPYCSRACAEVARGLLSPADASAARTKTENARMQNMESGGWRKRHANTWEQKQRKQRKSA